MKEPSKCQICGSIENDGAHCNWCHSQINDFSANEKQDEKNTMEEEKND